MILSFEKTSLNNNLGHGRVELVIMADGSLGYRLDGADAVTPFRREPQLVYTNVSWSFVDDGKTVTRTLDFSSVNGYDKLAANNILFDIISFSSGYTGVLSTVMNKSYNSETGILTCSVKTESDPYDGVNHAHANNKLKFNVYII